VRLSQLSVAVTGGASGLGLATARRLVDAGALVTVIDLPGSPGPEVAAELGDAAVFVLGSTRRDPTAGWVAGRRSLRRSRSPTASGGW
jgi:NAD(P)-dependent dehydrogenase (short-subunit alcohol dehydrogenase family)